MSSECISTRVRGCCCSKSVCVNVQHALRCVCLEAQHVGERSFIDMRAVMLSQRTSVPYHLRKMFTTMHFENSYRFELFF